MSKLEAIGPWIIVKPIKVKKPEHKLIERPETVEVTQIYAEVISVGKGLWLLDATLTTPMVKVGDTVVFGQNAGMPVEIDDEEYIVIREEAIWMRYNG